jgi:hypothetical protein
MSSILDPKFRYIPAAATDLKKTFARVRRELEARKKAEEQAAKSVTPISSRRKS